MYRGLIVEIKINYAIVMTSSGEYIKIAKKEAIEIGQKVYFTEEDIIECEKKQARITPLWIKASTLVAAILLIFLPIIWNIVPENEYAVVSLDINPSIEFILNEKQEILESIPLNDDAVQLKISNLKGKSFNEGIKELEKELRANGYLDKKTSLIVGMTIPEGEKSIAYEDDIKNVVKNSFSHSNILYIKAKEQDKQEAMNKKISIGRYEASKQLTKETDEEWVKNVSVEEIINNIFNDNDIDINEIGEYVEADLDELEDKKENSDDEYDEETEELDKEEEAEKTLAIIKPPKEKTNENNEPNKIDKNKQKVDKNKDKFNKEENKHQKEDKKDKNKYEDDIDKEDKKDKEDKEDEDKRNDSKDKEDNEREKQHKDDDDEDDQDEDDND